MPERVRSRGADERRAVTVHLNGRAIAARQGETVASALWASGRKVLSRSMRYHRARGLFCGTGECTHCFLRIDGVPNVRACQTACQDGLWAEDQNAWPSVRFDALAAGDIAFRGYLDAHRAFIRPRFMKPLYDRIIRGMAGFGRVPKEPVAQRFDVRAIHTDVLVVGGGSAGTACAAAAAEAGARVALVERDGRVGGRRAEAEAWTPPGLQELGVDVLTATRLVGLYADAGPIAASKTALVRIRPERIVLATGARDAYAVFPGSDRAGVLLAAAALRLLRRDGVLPGRRPVVVGATEAGVQVVRALAEHGIRPAAVYDSRMRIPARVGRDLVELGVRAATAHKPERAWGRRTFRRLRLATPAGRVDVEGDVLILATGRVARSELAQQAGCRLAWRPGYGFTVQADGQGATSVAGVRAVGSVAGSEAWDASARAGAAAGRAAAKEVSR